MKKTLYIINPAGHGGKGIKVWEQFQSEWPDRIDPEDVRFTDRQGHATEIAASAHRYDTLTAVGGDGTVGEVISGIMSQPEPHPKLGIITAGTCNDTARAVGIYTFEDVMDALHADHAKKFDLIRIDCHVDGRKAHRYAFLFGTVGFSATGMLRPWMKRYLGAKVAYYLSIILGIIAYRVPHMTIRCKEQDYSERAWVAYASNVELAGGGGMCIAPGALPDDGQLRVAIIPPRSRLSFLTRIMPKVPSGEYVKAPGVSYFSTETLEVDCEHPGVVEIDGDIFGAAPARFSICPQAVNVICPEQQPT